MGINSLNTKDIYIIRNKINNKVYIGQSINPQERWKAHKTAAKTGHYNGRSVLYEAMKKYGINYFYMEIIEKDVVNYNEREKYWISVYNSLAPNGYNLLEGGEQYPNFKGVKNAKAAVKDLNILNQIIFDLMNTLIPQTELAKKYNLPINTIHGINSGQTYFNGSYSYPLRKEKVIIKLNKNEILEITKLLKQNNISIKEIANRYNVSENTIQSINQGKTHQDITAEDNYPIRKEIFHKGALSEKQVDEIINLIINTKLSYREIARRYNVGHHTIISIKNGTTKKYKRDNLIYPLRPNN